MIVPITITVLFFVGWMLTIAGSLTPGGSSINALCEHILRIPVLGPIIAVVGAVWLGWAVLSTSWSILRRTGRFILRHL